MSNMPFQSCKKRWKVSKKVKIKVFLNILDKEEEKEVNCLLLDLGDLGTLSYLVFKV